MAFRITKGQPNGLAFLFMERVMGIEPTSQAWEAGILPMNYTRIDGMYYNTAVWILQLKSLDIFRKKNGA